MRNQNQKSEAGNSKNLLGVFGLSLSVVGALVGLAVVVLYILMEVSRVISFSSHEWFNYYCLAAFLSFCGVALSTVSLIWSPRRIALYGLGIGLFTELALIIVLMDGFTRMP